MDIPISRLARRAALPLVALLAVACSAGSEPEDLPDAAPTSDACIPGDGFDLNGRFAVSADLNIRINPEGGIPANQAAHGALLLYLDLTQTGTSAQMVGRLCDITLPEINLAGQTRPLQLVAGPGLIPSLPDLIAPATLDGTSTCAAYEGASLTMVMGAHMEPPAEGELPLADAQGAFPVCAPDGSSCATATGSGCACDQEPDGEPGVTLIASNVPGLSSLDEVYGNVRTTFTLHGQVYSSDLINGTTTASLEQGILACRMSDGRACTAAETAVLVALNPEIAADPDEPSAFVAVRVDSAMTCEDIVAQRATLFPR